MRPVLLEPRVAGISHNRQQPGATIPAVKTSEEFEGAHECFLRQVFRVRVIAHEPARQIVRGIQVR